MGWVRSCGSHGWASSCCAVAAAQARRRRKRTRSCRATEQQPCRLKCPTASRSIGEGGSYLTQYSALGVLGYCQSMSSQHAHCIAAERGAALTPTPNVSGQYDFPPLDCTGDAFPGCSRSCRFVPELGLLTCFFEHLPSLAPLAIGTDHRVRNSARTLMPGDAQPL